MEDVEVNVPKAKQQTATVSEKLSKLRQGGAAKYHQKLKEEKKLSVHDP